MVSRVTGGVTFVPGVGYVESSLLAQPTLMPQPTVATAPAPVLTQEAESAATGIEPQQLQAILYGKDIPVFVGGKMRIGGRIIEGPFFGGTSEAPTVSYIASHALCANPAGTRTITEFSLRGRVAWTVTDGALLDGLTVEFKTGSETQTPFASSVTRYGDSAIAYRGHILSCVTDLPLSTFAGVVPFPSVLVEDSTFGDPDDGITREDALETILRYARLDDDEFEVDVTGSDIAWILGQKTELIPFLQSLRKIFVNWNVTATDKLRIIEPGAFSIDATITRDNTIARSLKFSRVEPLTKPREKIYRFIDIDRDYEPNAATARQELFPFPTTASVESETIELPIVTQASQAVADVNYALFQEEVARKRLEGVGMVSLLGLEAGDGNEFEDHSHFRFRGRISETVKNAADWTIDFKSETWLNCNESGTPPTVTYEAHYEEDVTTPAVTFSNVDIGTASEDRLVVIVAGGITNRRTIDSITINGSPMAMHKSIAGIGTAAADPALAIASLVVSTGTTATVVVNFSGSQSGSFIGVHTITGYQSATPQDSASSSTSGGTDPAVSLDVPSGGTIVAAYATNGSSLSSVTWTGVSTEDFDEAIDSSLNDWWGSAAHQSNVSAEDDRLISVSGPSTGRQLLVAASWV